MKSTKSAARSFHMQRPTGIAPDQGARTGQFWKVDGTSASTHVWWMMRGTVLTLLPAVDAPISSVAFLDKSPSHGPLSDPMAWLPAPFLCRNRAFSWLLRGMSDLQLQ